MKKRDVSILKPLSLILSGWLCGCILPENKDPLLDTIEKGKTYKVSLVESSIDSLIGYSYIKLFSKNGKLATIYSVYSGGIPRDSVSCSITRMAHEISCRFDMEYGNYMKLKLFFRHSDGSLSYYAEQPDFSTNTLMRLIPHKTTSSLSLSDILDPVPPSQAFAWTWTGDAAGGGSQTSIRYSGDTLILDSTARVHFTTQDSSFGNGSYVFRFKARALDFGWRIPDSVSGKSLRLAYDPVGSPNKIKLIRGNWANQTVDFADSLEYMYEPDLWHVVQIVDSAGTLGIYFDGIKLDFFRTRPASQYLSGLGAGGIGIGTRNSGMKVSGMMGLR